MVSAEQMLGNDYPNSMSCRINTWNSLTRRVRFSIILNYFAPENRCLNKIGERRGHVFLS